MLSASTVLTSRCRPSQAPIRGRTAESASAEAVGHATLTVTEPTYFITFQRESIHLVLSIVPEFGKMMRERINMLTRSNLHAVEVKSAATQGNSSMKASMKGRDNSPEIPVNLFQSSRPPHYMPHARRNRKNQLPFPHPHVGNARSQHVAKRAAINLAWGIEVGRAACHTSTTPSPSNVTRSHTRGPYRLPASCPGGSRRLQNGPLLLARLRLRRAGCAARGCRGAVAFSHRRRRREARGGRSGRQGLGGSPGDAVTGIWD